MLRDDLYYRFELEIHMPPLRDRKEDIPLLVNAFLEQIAQNNDQHACEVSSHGLKVLMDYDWPGNVRELRKVLMQADMVAEDNTIKSRDIPIPYSRLQKVIQGNLSLKDSVEQLKRAMIERALDDCDGNKTRAAEQLGVVRQSLQNMMRRMNMK